MDERDDLRAELVDISREKKHLQIAAYLWERHAPRCTGSCAKPVVVAIDVGGTFTLDCCTFHGAYRRFTILRGTETMIRDRLKDAA